MKARGMLVTPAMNKLLSIPELWVFNRMSSIQWESSMKLLFVREEANPRVPFELHEWVTCDTGGYS